MTRKNKSLPKPVTRSVYIKDLTTREDDFQFRKVKRDRGHAEELAEVLRRGQELDPIIVWIDDGADADSGQMVVVDGHHRLEAYRMVGWTDKVKVRVYRGDRLVAHKLCMADNQKTRKPMTRVEKSDYAWTMVKEYHNRLIIKELTELAGVSRRQVMYMKGTLKRLSEAEEVLPASWEKARRLSSGEESAWTDEDREEWRRASKEKLKDKIAPAILPYRDSSPDIIMEAVAEILGEDRFDTGCDWMGYKPKVTDFEDIEDIEDIEGGEYAGDEESLLPF